VLLGVSVGLLIAAELTLRATGKAKFMPPRTGVLAAAPDWGRMVHIRSRTPGLSYELNPGFSGESKGMNIQVNSLGMRDDEPAPADTPGLTRIAAIGDSFTFGMSVQQGEDFPAQLEHLLRASEPAGGRFFDVLNFGVTGYGSLHEAAVLREKALAFDPRVVVLAYCFNDPECYPLEGLEAFFHDTEWWQRSHLLRYCVGKRRAWDMKKYGGGRYMKMLDAVDGPTWPRTAKALDEFRDLCSARSIPVVFVVMPMLQTHDWPSYDAQFAGIHAHVAAEARARGFTVLDPLDALRPFTLQELTISPENCHLSALGNAIVARELEPVLRAALETAK